MSKEDYYQMRNMNIKTFVLHIPDENNNSKFNITDEYIGLLNEVIEDSMRGDFRIDHYSCHGQIHPAIKKLIEKSGKLVDSRMCNRAGNIKEECEVSATKKEGEIICRWCAGTALDKNVLLPDGTVLMCSMDFGMQFVLGNLLTEDYEEIAEGKRKILLRKKLQSEEYGDILCRNCHRSMERTKWEAHVKEKLERDKL